MKIADKDTRAVDLVRKALDKAKEFEEYNVFISLNDEALKKAEEIDRRIAAGEKVGRLAGVPYALKDDFLSPEGKTTAGSKMLENFRSPITATAVAKLETEDAICLGRTNMDAFSHGASTENSYFGPTLNSRDKTRAAGGSSGGSAVAVALGIVPFALGTDTGGSIRQPAAYNGVIGVRPTYGAVSRYGVIAMSSSIDTVGCFATTADDADLVMGVMAGRDEADATSLDDFWSAEPENKKLRVGVIKDFMNSADGEVLKCTNDYIDKLKGLGHEVSEIEMPTLKYGLAIYYVVQSAELASTMMRFDSIRFGRQAENVKGLDDLYTRSRDEGLMMENKRRIMLGNYVVSTGLYEKYYLKAQKARTLLMAEYDRAFEKFDVLLCPTTPSTAFKLGSKTGDPMEMYLEDLMLASPSMAGLPAISVPAGETTEGLTVGVQLVGPQCSDRSLLKLAKETM
ncbi:Asp-tRNA(Asn)/Glu-tRNA(Gln) amidotransferase subunit GatA [Candidatus Saccharibacteria bacterium]|nr:Asp-tRNA(Asn)/Glu-tRNA(Gln) amidotransferase subunit GatA [Candidatus Saccharibacteria bacterium]